MNLKKLGRYDLIRVLGKGAMGLVYEGRDPNLNRRVAVKTIKVDNLSEEAASEYEVRFRNEAHSAARLQHPNIVSVYDSDRDGDIAFLVLEYVEGNDLKHHLDKGEVFTLTQTIGIMSDLLSALSYAHNQKIVHRDVKPANLLVQASGRIKLADFGVARIQDSGDVTRTQGSIVGTLKYMSPEQLEGRPIDARADLFAAGVLLYQLLTGKRPFDGDTDFAVIQNIVGLTPPSVTICNAKLPLALDAVLAKALAKSRDQRFLSADDFMDALRLASTEAEDPTVTPQKPILAAGSNSTWTQTLAQGESLAPTRAGLAGGTGTSADSVLLAQEVELLYWKDIRESDEVPDIQQFLVKFPEGIYADLARRKLKLMGVVPINNAPVSVAAEQVLLESKSLQGAGPRAKAAKAAKAASAPAAQTADKYTESAAIAGKKTHPAVWALLAVAAITLGVVALKVTRSSNNPAAGAVSAASSPLSAASAASASLGLGPGETAVVSFGAEGSTSKSVSVTNAVATTPAVTSTAIFGVPLTAASGVTMPIPAAASAASAASAVVRVPLSPASMAQRQAAAAARAASAAAAAKRLTPDAAPAVKDEPSQAASVPAPVAARPRSPSAPAISSASAACEGRVLFGFQICMAEQCAKPAFAQQAACVERRQMDERRREADRSR